MDDESSDGMESEEEEVVEGMEVVENENEDSGEEGEEDEQGDDEEEGDEEDQGNDEDGDEDELYRDAKRQKLSAAVWYTAATKLDTGARCNICKKVFSVKDGSPSNVTKHVEKQHAGTEECKKLMALKAKNKREKAKKAVPKPKLSVKDFFHGKRILSKHDTQKITKALADFIAGTNTSLAMVENPHFRKLVFVLNSGYVVPARKTITEYIDNKIVETKKNLAEEIADDIKEHKTVSITTDGGPSHDVNKTKKNTVTISRISSKWEMKTDTLALRVAEGSQSAEVIRTVIRDVLDEFGRKEDWDINATTDNASAPRSARALGSYRAVGLPIKYDSYCIDHQFHLLVSFVFS